MGAQPSFSDPASHGDPAGHRNQDGRPAAEGLLEQLSNLSLPRAWRSESEAQRVEMVARCRDAVPGIVTEKLAVVGHDRRRHRYLVEPVPHGLGSGVIVDAGRGLVLTNYHVVKDAEGIAVQLAEDSKQGARLLYADEALDLAVLQLKTVPDGLKSVPLGDSGNLEQAQSVVAIGNPFGLEGTVTSGIVSSLDRELPLPNGRTVKMIQADAAINPGNSGGALLDLDGRLVGINTFIFSKSGTSSGVGFAIPVNEVRRVLKDAINLGIILRPRLGISFVDTDAGPLAVEVDPGSPADRAGVRGLTFGRGRQPKFNQAFFLEKINGRRVETVSQLREVLEAANLDKPMSLSFKIGQRRPFDAVIKPN